MIKTIIFDFGAIFINLDKQGAMDKMLSVFGLPEIPETIVSFNILYEQGLVSTEEFLKFYSVNFPKLSKSEIINLWNSILMDFPESRLRFLKRLASEEKYQIILLSNTNDLHISWIKENILFYEEFKSQFDAFYLSHEIHLRKPNADIYNFVLERHNLKAKDCLFIDDTKANTDAAESLGIHVWNLDETHEDVSQLFHIKPELF